MIKSLHIQNFKCLRDVKVELKPLTVLIGKNDTGKSSMLDALFMLGRIAAGDLEAFRGAFAVTQLAWRGVQPPVIRWDVELAPSGQLAVPSTTTYAIALRARDEWGYPEVESEKLTIDGSKVVAERRTVQSAPHQYLEEGSSTLSMPAGSSGNATALAAARRDGRFPLIGGVSRFLSSSIKYRLDPYWVTKPSGFDEDAGFDEDPRLRHDGYGLPAVLEALLGSRRTHFDEIERELRAAIPQVATVQLKPWKETDGTGRITKRGRAVHFELKGGGFEISTPLASNGLIAFLAYLTLVHSPSHPSVILIEEPENGIHPRQLERLIGLFRKLTETSKLPPQIVLSTHSPYLLDWVPASNVLVFGRRDNGESVVAPLATLPGVKERISGGFTVGELWYNVGEERLLADLLK